MNNFTENDLNAPTFLDVNFSKPLPPVKYTIY